jgi:hypothetical protein
VEENIVKIAGCPQITIASIWIAGSKNPDHTIPHGDSANLKDTKRKQGIIQKQKMKRERYEINWIPIYKIC